MVALYTPTIVPSDLNDPLKLQAWLDREFKNIANSMDRAVTVTLDPQFVLPSKLEEGVIYYADGTSWNPGSGEGYYGYVNGAFVFLSTTLTSLGVSAFIQTLLNDADAITARTTLEIPWELIASGQSGSVATLDFTNLSPYNKLRFTWDGAPINNGVNLQIRGSTNNGVSYAAGAADYSQLPLRVNNAGLTNAAFASDSLILNSTAFFRNDNLGYAGGVIHMFSWNKPLASLFRADTNYLNSGASLDMVQKTGLFLGTTARDAFRMMASSGNININYVLEGIRG